MGAKERLLKYIDYKGIKKADFYKITGLSNGFLDKNVNISSDKIEIIISSFSDLSLKWLITGNGEMLKVEGESPTLLASEEPAKYLNIKGKTENIFTGETNQEIEDYISDAFAKYLLEMYETGRAYPAAIVKSIIDEKNSRITELEKKVKELDRKLDRNIKLSKPQKDQH